MRTTVDLPNRLLSAARKRARERETTLSAVVADALRVALAQSTSGKAAGRFTLVTFRGDGVLPGVDLDRSSELYEVDDVDVFRVSDGRSAPARSRRKKRKGTRR